MLDITLVNTENYLHPKNDYVFPQSHTCYEIVWYRSGKGECVVENEVYYYNKNDLMLISPYCLHEERSYEETEVYFFLFNLNNLKIDTKLLTFDEKVFEKLKPLLDKIIEVYEKKELYFADVVSGILVEVIAIILRNYYSDKVNIKNQDIKEIVKLTKKEISRHAANEINFEQLAMNFGYSYDRFRHIFKQESKTSLKNYQLECRLTLAKKLLVEREITIQQVALRCGFNSLVRFTTFFTERMKMTPSEYRKAGLNKVDVITLKQ